MFHIALHFLVPAAVAGLFFRQNWKTAFLVMAATIIVDIDHLLASPVYDPLRCSIGFHPLHGFWAIGIYALLCFLPKLRYVGIGLMIHMALDALSCQSTQGVWFV
jgi:hypothetical protein